mgnify:CR=1 FL=1
MRLCLLLAANIALAGSTPPRVTAEPPGPTIVVTSTRRLAANPLVHLNAGDKGPSINGPTLIRVPAWVEKPLGKYYLYYATHRESDNIRLLYADAVEGPWRQHEPGSLQGSDVLPPFRGGVASPDVLFDEQAREVLVYFHGGTGQDWPRLSQASGLAVSKDGVNFTVPSMRDLGLGEDAKRAPIFGDFYLRVFRWNGRYYGVAKAPSSVASVWRSDDPRKPFELGTEWDFPVRHMAVLVRGDRLLLFYCDRGDKPERIRLRTVELTGDVADWKVSEPVDVMYPFADYEGVAQPMRPGGRAMKTNWHSLRDPHVFEDDGRCYLSYAVAGESGVAIAEVTLSATAANPRFQPQRVDFYTYRTTNDPWRLVGSDEQAPHTLTLTVEPGMEFAVARFTTAEGEVITSMPPVRLLGSPLPKPGEE